MSLEPTAPPRRLRPTAVGIAPRPARGGRRAAATAVFLVGSLTAAALAEEVETLAPPPAKLPPLGRPGDLDYAVGYRLGRQLRADLESIDVDADPEAIVAGLREALAGREPSLSRERFSGGLAGFDARIAARDAALMRKFAAKAAANRERGRAFLADRRGRPGVRELPGGTQIEVRKRGGGRRPTVDDELLVHYSGSRLDGEVFDATDPAGPPARIRLREVIPGWQQALLQMSEGARWRIAVPPEQAYGEEGAPPVIEPNEVLIFEIELVAISPKA